MNEKVKDEYQETRVALLKRGKSIRSWALDNDFPVGSVYNAIRNRRNGVEAYRIRTRLHAFLNEPTKIKS